MEFKKSTIAIIVGGIIVVTLAVAFYVSYFIASNNSSNAKLSLLTVIDKSVWAKPGTQDNFHDVNGSQQINEGWRVKTSETGRAFLEGAGSTTAIDKNTDFTLKEQSNGKTTIELTAGNLWANVTKKFASGQGYKIEAPNATALTQEASFGVAYANHITVILVQESKVQVVSIDPKTRQPVGNAVTVNAGQRAVVEDGKEPVVQSATPATP